MGTCGLQCGFPRYSQPHPLLWHNCLLGKPASSWHLPPLQQPSSQRARPNAQNIWASALTWSSRTMVDRGLKISIKSSSPSTRHSFWALLTNCKQLHPKGSTDKVAHVHKSTWQSASTEQGRHKARSRSGRPGAAGKRKQGRDFCPGDALPFKGGLCPFRQREEQTGRALPEPGLQSFSPRPTQVTWAEVNT